ncbi:hypothetical protein D9619_009740 [Psilocybe cf. subviscida]|uniref:Reverse transcriptase domain-containing protein n=1 Tax=Psilocybe cf. subviscida TaxID=2480587 RepID=A0A8H5F6D2_9AGAR|nr:hypothetical protein D9619_009740 [Psilocybe cf. subviscida]
MENSGPAASDGRSVLATVRTSENDGRCFRSGEDGVEVEREVEVACMCAGTSVDDREAHPSGICDARALEVSEPNPLPHVAEERQMTECTGSMQTRNALHAVRGAPHAPEQNATQISTQESSIPSPCAGRALSSNLDAEARCKPLGAAGTPGAAPAEHQTVQDSQATTDAGSTLSDKDPSAPPSPGLDNSWIHASDFPRSLTGSLLDVSSNENRAQRRNLRRTAQSRKAAIKIASLNINGYGAPNIYHPANKWQHMGQVMRNKRIAVLMIQEAHLTQQRVDEIHSLVDRRLRIMHSEDPENPTGRAGIAFVLNKQFLKLQDVVEPTVIVAGRAMLLRLKIGDKEMRILNVYAPNASSENAQFWQTLRKHFDEHPSHKPDVMAGDFNMVEEVIDRLPIQSLDGKAVLKAFDDLKMDINVTDGWRATFPDDRRFTYRQQTLDGSKSRLDRIYVKHTHFETAREWKIEKCAITSDHDLVSAQIVNDEAPEIGRGRWTFPDFLLRDKVTMEYIIGKGAEAVAKVRLAQQSPRDPDNNAQTIFSALKSTITNKAKERERSLAPQAVMQLRKLEDELSEVLHDNSLNAEDCVRESNRITMEMEKVERERHLKERVHAKAHNFLEGETVSQYWSAVNREIKPRDVFYALKKTTLPGVDSEQPDYEKDSSKMAELAREYHKSLQEDGAEIHISPARQLHINEALGTVTKRVNEEQVELLEAKIGLHEVVNALEASGNAKSPGLDGITYEVYKSLNKIYEGTSDTEETTSFDVLDLLTEVFLDIAKHGVHEATNFTEGWMCPLYKKNDKNDIANYRPLTILNTDYKLFTKVWAMRFAQMAPSVLHESQAGFVPGRQIADQTKLIQSMIVYAEAFKKNGLIVALDQEKAYDKIDHAYLWQVLGKFGVPDSVINTIKSLYTHAQTGVMINGHLSSHYRVTRGVRQGDPLSCLLFDLAIEPLAAMLRASSLSGFDIPGHAEKLIANLFADDTTVFLAESDDFSTLQNILEKWCCASTAKFNINKTEIIPIGTEEFREHVLSTRTLRQGSEPIPPHLRIAKDGDAVRILGAWVGNNINNLSVWAPTIEKIDAHLDRWSKSHPTMEGRRLIVQMIVGGMTQYLTNVQGMPRKIEKRLVKRIRRFIWDDKTVPPVNTETLYMPIAQGGRAVLDIVARNEAIKLMWLRRYLNLGPERPIWAKVLDCIAATKVPLSQKNVPLDVRINVFLQSWHTEVGHKAPLPTRELVKTAQKHNV